jgi:hypothetical protein
MPLVLAAHPAIFVRLGEIALAAMDQHALGFRQHLGAFLALFCESMLQMPVDRAALQAKPKALMIVTRFLARAMLNSSYNSARLARLQPQSEWGPKAAQAREAEVMVEAAFSAERCAVVVRAIVNKYLVLTPAELEEWEDTPEQSALNDTVGLLEAVEIGEAESPRPCGHALLLCMAVRQPEVVCNVVLSYAEELQQQQPPTTDTWVLRDACYHAIGACAARLRGKIDFDQWYRAELRVHLDAPAEGTELLQRVLQARALWLTSQFVTNTASTETKSHAVQAVLRFMGSADVKLALVAARVLYVLIVSRRADVLGPDGGEGGTEAQGAGLYGALAGQALERCFSLLRRVQEVENVVALLRLLALFLIHAGDGLIPHFDALANALPQAWQTIEAQGSAAGTRAHAVMLNVVASLLRTLKMQALGHPALAGVVFQLLNFVTDPAALASGHEDLLDDGLTLWYSALRAFDQVGPQLMGLVGRLPSILASNREPCKGLLLLEGYALLGGEEFMTAHGTDVAGAVAQILLNADSSRTNKELLLAASVAENFMQLNAQGVVSALQPAFVHMMRAVASGELSGVMLTTFTATICRLLVLDANTLVTISGGNEVLAEAFITNMVNQYAKPQVSGVTQMTPCRAVSMILTAYSNARRAA